MSLSIDVPAMLALQHAVDELVEGMTPAQWGHLGDRRVWFVTATDESGYRWCEVLVDSRYAVAAMIGTHEKLAEMYGRVNGLTWRAACTACFPDGSVQ